MSGSICVGVESQWIKTGVTGRLIYVPDAEGDHILDFSNVGYRASGSSLIPSNVPTSVTLSPIAGDDTSSIQAAIDQVSALPLGPDGYRGAVLLQAGTYDIDSQLEIRASGVVLRGEGRDGGGTVLHGRNPLSGGTNPNQRPLIRVYGNGSRSNVGSTRNMIDKVVPAGARSFRVDVPGEFSVGDTVRIERPSTEDWIVAVGMDDPPNNDPNWKPGTMNVRYDRVITRIEGDRVFVDAPLANSFEQQYGGGTIRRYTWSGAIENVGIENLRGDTDFTSATDEDHAWEFISIGGSQNADRAQNVWVRDITAAHFGDSAVVANPGTKWVTVDDAINETPVSQITGSRRYSYDLSGELGFVTNAQADEGRHDFVNNSTRPPGPNVFHQSTATNANSDSGPHQRWATGTLFDNITVQGNAINARNRGSFGTAHGWSGANMVVWNSTADSFRIQNPPTAQNWLIGSTGTIVEDTTFGPQPSGNYDSHGTPVTAGGTTSLYDAQASDAQDITVFRSLSGSGNWTDAQQWDARVAPVDSYTVSLRDYLVGDIDDYTYDGVASIDDVFIDPNWQAAVLGSSSHPIAGLDSLSDNQNVTFTIQHTLDAGEQVVHGFLALAIKQSGGLINTDFVRLFDFDAQHRLFFSDLGWDTEINATDTFVGVIDMGSFLEDMQSGSVNVQVNDDTGLDWASYTVAVATPKNDTSATSVFIENGGIITVDSAVSPVGQLTLGDGIITAGTLQIESTGVVDVDGDYTQSEAGVLVIELAGDAIGQFGRLDVLDAVGIQGALEVSLDGSFQPIAGDQFEFLSGTSLSGTFDTTLLPALSPGLVWDLNYLANAVLLDVLFAADFNGDGSVNEIDLAQWQSSYGALSADHSDGDANGDGRVDGLDFLVWQQQNGFTATLSAIAQVPEPASLLITLSAFGIWPFRRMTQYSRVRN